MEKTDDEKTVMIWAYNLPSLFPLTKVRVDRVSVCGKFVRINGSTVQVERPTYRICPDFETAKQYLVNELARDIERQDNRLRYLRQRLEDVLATQESDIPEDDTLL